MSGVNNPTFSISSAGEARIDGILHQEAWSESTIHYSFPTNTNVFDYKTPLNPFDNQVGWLVDSFRQVSQDQEDATHFALNAHIGGAASSGFAVEGFTDVQINHDSTPDSGNPEHIRVSGTTDSQLDTAQVADFPEGDLTNPDDDNGDAWFGPSNNGYRNPRAGNYEWHTHLHEFGHALGLAHGHDDGGGLDTLPSSWDTMEYSVMTYRSSVDDGLDDGMVNETWGYAQTYMMLDIAALQHLYGADYSTNSGDTVYSWTPGSGDTRVNGSVAIDPGANRIFATIWDGGGEDTYDLSAYSDDLEIDLAPGEHSVFDDTQLAFLGDGNDARGNIFNALLHDGDTRSLIENATGGSGNDEISGNQTGNALVGGAGVDTLEGKGGNDDLTGGSGADILRGGAGNDSFRYDVATAVGNDTLRGQVGSDRILIDGGGTFDLGSTAVQISSVEEIEFAEAGAGATLVLNAQETDGSGELVNTLVDGWALAGDETVRVIAGALTNIDLSGWSFQDWNEGQDDTVEIVGDSSSETITGTSNVDSISGNGGDDRLHGLDDDDSLSGGSGDDELKGGKGDDDLDGDGGDDIFVLDDPGNTGNDSFDGGSGFDEIVVKADGTYDLGSTAVQISEIESLRFDGGGAGSVVILNAQETDAFNEFDDVEIDGWANPDTGSEVVRVLGGPLTTVDLSRWTFSGWNPDAGDLIQIDGDSDAETLIGTREADSVEGNKGDDALRGEAGDDQLRGGDGQDTIDGGKGDDLLKGNAGNDDFLLNDPGNTGVDRFDGGAGFDEIVVAASGTYDLSPNLVNISFVEALRFDEAGAGSTVVLSSLETGGSAELDDVLIDGWNPGGTGAETVRVRVAPLTSVDLSDWLFTDWNPDDGDRVEIVGDGDDESITGTRSSDSIEGGGGDDDIDGGDGADEILGGAGVDTIDGEGGDDHITSDGDGGTYRGGPGDDMMLSGIGDETMDGGTGVDTIDHSAYGLAYVFDMATGKTNFPGEQYDNFENAIMGAGDDTVTGTTDVNAIRAGGGDDRLIGSAGGDSLHGEAGSDTVDYSGSLEPVQVNLSEESGQGGDAHGDTLIGIENVIGSDYRDRMVGSEIVDNALDGGDGDDVLSGLSGNDVLTGGDGKDLFVLGDGHAGASADTIADLDLRRDLVSLDWSGALPRLSETASGDTRLTHENGTAELVGVSDERLGFGDILFDMAETGTTTIGSGGTTVSLERDFANPVVFASSTTSNGVQPITVRVSDVQADQFDIALQEPDSLDGVHRNEEVSWGVFEAGTWTLDNGAKLEVGTFSSSRLSSDGFETLEFSENFFDDRPTLLSQTQTANGPDWVITRERQVDSSGAELAMQEEEALNDGGHVQEQIGWLAIDRGAGNWRGQSYEAGSTGVRVADSEVTQSLSGGFSEAPGLLTSLSSFRGPDTANARVTSVDRNNFDLFAQEETSRDAETGHVAESVDFLAFGNGDQRTLGAHHAAPFIAEYGTVGMDDSGASISFERSYLNPVVFAVTNTSNGRQPVNVRVTDISADGFEAYLQEPGNLDQTHAIETVSWMVVEAGTWELDDGTVLQAGSTLTDNLTSDGFVDVAFDPLAFQGSPTALSQVQTDNGSDWVTPRMQGIDASGMQLAMQEEGAKNAGAHVDESVGWLAIEPGTASPGDDLLEAGRTADSVTHAGISPGFSQAFGQSPVLLSALSSFDGPDPAYARATAVTASGFDVAAQEETSADAETIHTSETADWLALSGDGKLGGTAHRPVIAETGTLTLDHEETTVTLSHDFVDPVVLAGPPSQNGSQPVAVRITDVQSDSFTAYLQEPSNENGEHVPESMGWMVVEAGEWRLPDGSLLQAGTVETDKLAPAGSESVAFAESFSDTPAVFSQVQSDAGPDWVVTRQHSVGASGFEIAMQEEEAKNSGGHVQETLGWMALETGTGNWDGHAFEARELPETLNSTFDEFVFDQSFAEPPLVLSDLTTLNGADPAALRHDELDAGGLDLRVMEETSADAETFHIDEAASLFAMEGTGLLAGEDWA